MKIKKGYVYPELMSRLLKPKKLIKHRKLIKLYMIALLLAAPAALSASQGYASLKIAVGARSSAMGEAGVAGSSAADALRWNPALLVSGGAVDVSLHHTRWLVGSSQSAVLFSRNLGRVAIGAEVLYFTGGEIELRDSIPSDDPTGTYTFADLSAGLGVAVEVIKGTRVGVVARFFNERLWNYSGSTWGFDVGLDYSPLEGLDVAFSVIDMGFDTRLATDAFKPPMSIRLGTAYTRQWSEKVATSTNLDFLYRPFEKQPGIRTGIEVKLFDLLALRAGVKFLYFDENDELAVFAPSDILTFGIGIAHKGVGVDYALVPYTQMDLGLTHRISLNFAFD